MAGLGLLACSSSGSDQQPHLRVEKTCLLTECDDIQQRGSRACADCTNACSRYSKCDVEEDCNVSCGERECSESQRNACKETGFKATLGEDHSKEVDAERRRAFRKAGECGWKTTSSEACCTYYARLERSERAKSYACIADLPRDPEDFAACDPEPSSLGAQLCDAAAAKCEDFCSDEQRIELDRRGAWLRDDVIAAGMSCTTHASCGDVRGCFRAWLKIVAP
jgi:hypothetical protein